MITTKYTHAIHLHQTAQQRLDEKPITLTEVHSNLQSIQSLSEIHNTILGLLPTTKTIPLSKFCTQLYHRLLTQIQPKAEKLKAQIQSVLSTHIRTIESWNAKNHFLLRRQILPLPSLPKLQHMPTLLISNPTCPLPAM